MITGSAFIEFAEKLAESKTPTEAGQRSAVSRAYYGAFHLAKAYFQEIGIPVGAKHELHNFLMSCGQEEARCAGQGLGRLLSYRIRADYHLDKAWVQAGYKTPDHFVRYCVEAAREVERLLATCASESIKPIVKSGVERILRNLNRPMHRPKDGQSTN